MSTAYTELVSDVRAQVSITAPVALRWLLDRARMMNSEAQWLIAVEQIIGDGGRYHALPPDAVSIEAVIVDTIAYERSTAHKLDGLYDGGGGSGQGGLYAEGQSQTGAKPTLLQTFPAIAAGSSAEVRYVADVPDPAVDPYIPFPDEFAPALVDGAIATGLARMDERFDSAGYFEARFQDQVQRLRRRRHGRVGRGFQTIRVYAP